MSAGLAFDTLLRARRVRREPSACLPRFTRLLGLSFFLPLHGHVDDVQREVARQCGLAYILLFQALLFSRTASWWREEPQATVPSVVLFLVFVAAFLNVSFGTLHP